MFKKILLCLLLTSPVSLINPIQASEYEEFTEDGLDYKSDHLAYIFTTVERFKEGGEEQIKTQIPGIRQKYLTPGVRWHGAIDESINQKLNEHYHKMDAYQEKMLLKLVSTGLIKPEDIQYIPKHSRLVSVNAKLITQSDYNDSQQQEKQKRLKQQQEANKIEMFRLNELRRLHEENIKKENLQSAQERTRIAEIERIRRQNEEEQRQKNLRSELSLIGFTDYNKILITKDLINSILDPLSIFNTNKSDDINIIMRKNLLQKSIQKLIQKFPEIDAGKKHISFLISLDKALFSTNIIEIEIPFNIHHNQNEMAYNMIADILFKKITKER